jgi:hypothetical protein
VVTAVFAFSGDIAAVVNYRLSDQNKNAALSGGIFGYVGNYTIAAVMMAIL